MSRGLPPHASGVKPGSTGSPVMNGSYSAERIRSALRTKEFGGELHFFESTESTQLVALNLAEGGCPEGVLVVADEQTAGVGRRGRTWHSARGLGIWMSLVLRPPISPSDAGLLASWAGLAVLGALGREGWGGREAGLKWPNDVLVGGRKLCGILIDAQSLGGRVAHAVVGVGLNVNHSREDFPPDIASSATSISILMGNPGDRAGILSDIVLEMERTYPTALTYEGRRSIAADAQRVSVLIGREITVEGGGRPLRGIALRIDVDGALVVQSPGAGKEQKVYAGEVEMVRVREGKR